MERCTSLAISQPTAERTKRKPAGFDELRGLDLAQIAFESATPEKRQRPKRLCMAPLEAWRNERVTYERLPGSMTPSVRGVVFNVAGRGGSAQPLALTA